MISIYHVIYKQMYAQNVINMTNHLKIACHAVRAIVNIQGKQHTIKMSGDIKMHSTEIAFSVTTKILRKQREGIIAVSVIARAALLRNNKSQKLSILKVS